MADDVLHREHDIGEPAAVVESVGGLVIHGHAPQTHLSNCPGMSTLFRTQSKPSFRREVL